MIFKDALKNAFPYSSPEGVRKGVVRMDLNENAFGCSPQVMEALNKLGPMDIAMYPDYGPLLTLVSEKKKVGTDRIILTAGADDALRCVMDALLSPGDQIMVPRPNYSMYEIISLPLGAEVVFVDFDENGALPGDRLRNALSSCKMAVFTNPPSPIGNVYERVEMKRLLEEYPETCFLIDETYAKFIGWSFMDLIKDYDNLVIIQSLSKLHGLAGLRVGMVFSREENIREFSKTAMPYALNTAAVAAAEAALNDEDWLMGTLEKIHCEKEKLKCFFKDLGYKTILSPANFILVDFGERKRMVYEALKEENILIKDMKSYPGLETYLRITVGNEEWDRRLMENITDIVSI